MTARSPHEAHRAATPLELLFDLVFVFAIAQAASGLHHATTAAHILEGLIGYLMVFFAIWWAWMNFTWLRAAASDPARRKTGRRYAAGITVLQLAWIAALFVPGIWITAFLTLATFELALPVWAEGVAPTTWHPHHIAERYGLLTLIVLGESILAATIAVQSALSSGEALSALVPLIIGGLLIVYSMWWMYFDRPVHDLLTSLRKAILWGYGHYLVFASAAAVGAGLAVSVDDATHHAKIASVAAGAAVAVPVAVFLMCLWFLHDRPEYGKTRVMGPIATVLILLTPLSGHAVLLTGTVLAALLGVKLVVMGRAR
jgi:low temperature requirement protein LtrA